MRHEICNVFKDEELRSNDPSQAEDFIEQSAASSGKSGLLSGAADVLAGKSGGDDVMRAKGWGVGGYVVVDWYVGPVAV